MTLTREECVEVDIDEPVKRDTAKAILICVEGEDLWIPQSVIHEDSEVFAEGDTGKLIVAEWFATKVGLA